MPIRKLRTYYHKLIASHATPREVAGGFALGIFVAMTPTIGFHTIITLALAAFTRQNKIASLLGCWVVNPLTLFPVFYFIYRIGHWLLGTRHIRQLRPESLTDMLHMGQSVMAPLLVGGVFVGLVSAFASYWIVLTIYPRFKKFKHDHSSP
ncbi:MAG TPA: hypothetical protein DDW49_06950 [Deltaproteobacteria bacterium]|nr:MAG: hypothetical protein A2048_07365 [Deltaproteobacteria bacterium GWA2_45_12]HBF13108.1 hypothetical protein [Deltaproteobacteria bacterium]